MHFRHYSLRKKISFKISFQCSLKLIWSKSSMELAPEFHGTFWTTFEEHLWFHGIPWNSMEFCPDSKFHGFPWNFFHTPEFHGIQWNFWFSPKNVHGILLNSMELFWSSMEFHGTFNFPPKMSMAFYWIPWNFFEVPWNSMEFHGTWWISYLKKSYF